MTSPRTTLPGFLTLFVSVLALVRRHAEPVGLIGGLFLFLPMMALLLFLPPPALTGNEEDLVKHLTAYAQKASIPMLAITLPMAFGNAAILSVFLGTGNRTIGGHLGQAGRLFAGFLALVILVRLLVGLGMQLLLLPGLAAYVATFLSKPAMLAEQNLNPFAALKRGLEIPRGRFGQLAALLFLTMFGAFLGAMVFLMLVSGFFALVVPQAVFGLSSVLLAAFVITALMVMEMALSVALYAAFTGAGG